MAQTMPGGSDFTEVAGGIHPKIGFLFTPDDSIARVLKAQGVGSFEGGVWGGGPAPAVAAGGGLHLVGKGWRLSTFRVLPLPAPAVGS